MTEAHVVEVSAGVFAYIQPDGSWYINNTGFVAGRTGVVSIDTCSTARRTSAFLAAVRSVTTAPVRTLVNTHHHGDHTYGNCLLPGATIVAHERCREEVLAAGPPANRGLFSAVEWGDLPVAAPFLTFTEGVTLWVDDLRCEVRYVGRAAHTSNDSIVFIPSRSVLFCGDLLFAGGMPFLLMGSVAGAVDVLENVLRPLSAAVIVPGHGPVSGPSLLDDVLEYLRFVQSLAADGFAAGLSPLETARSASLGAFGSLLDAERIVGNLHVAFAELGGPPVDVMAAFADMIAYNGGRPLSCHA